jgi:hypothetical protein
MLESAGSSLDRVVRVSRQGPSGAPSLRQSDARDDVISPRR